MEKFNWPDDVGDAIDVDQWNTMTNRILEEESRYLHTNHPHHHLPSSFISHLELIRSDGARLYEFTIPFNPS